MCQRAMESTLRSERNSEDLLTLYDDFVEFQGSCAFFFDAVTSMLDAGADLDNESIEGMKSYAERIKEAANDLKNQLSRIRELSS